MNINYLDFFEIGTCVGTGVIYQKLTKEYNHDFIFMTSIADRVPEGTYGFSVEPVKNYLDNLNAPDSINKLNCAISNKNYEAEIFYVSVEDAISHGLYSWVIGCACLHKPDEKLIKHLKEKNCLHLLTKDIVQVRDINYLIKLYNIQSIEYLKIDTEGQDYEILLSLFNSDRGVIIDKIQFESYFIDDRLLEIKNYLKSKNYIELHGGHDTFFINKNSLSRLLCNPNLLDKIFIEDIKYNLDIKNYENYN